MQTILGANGQIAIELARELQRNHTNDLRLVSRNPRKVNETDSLVSANLLDARQTDRLQTEDTPFAPVGRKGKVRAAMASMVLEEMARGEIPVLIGRAPEFYDALVIEKLQAGKKPRVPVRGDTRRTLIWTPDASRALAALGNAPDAFGQTWHLPCCDDRLTYQEFVAMASEVFGREPAYSVIGKWTLTAAGLFSKPVREIRELLPRYERDNLFDSTKFKRRFPGFTVTTYRQGLELIRREGMGR